MELADFSLDVFSLSGRVALVSGGNTGLGRAISVALAAAGADICVVSVEDDEGHTRDLVEGRGRRYAEHRVDLTQPDGPDRAVEHCVADLGALDVLVNCAGTDAIGGLLEVTREQVRQLYEVNLLAPVDLVNQALPAMVARGSGHLVTVSSGFSTVIGPGLVPYASSKAGLSHFHAGVRAELQGTGVGTTLVEPGPVDTGMYDELVDYLKGGSTGRWKRGGR